MKTQKRKAYKRLVIENKSPNEETQIVANEDSIEEGRSLKKRKIEEVRAKLKLKPSLVPSKTQGLSVKMMILP